MDYALCPQCDLPAEVLDRFSLFSTDGPIEHVKTACLAGHVFTPAADDVTFVEGAPEAPAVVGIGRRR
jgi:hypothetical protein